MNYRIKIVGLLWALFVSIAVCASSEILLFTYAYNRPDFIEIQWKTFKKFLKDDYEFIVFNDAKDTAMEHAIQDTCARLAIRCIRIPQSIHSQPYLKRWPGEGYQDPAVRNCNVVMYSLNEIGFDHNGIVVLLDSDMFLIRDFSIKEYMHTFHVAGLEQPRNHVIYLWIGLAFLDMRTMPNRCMIDFNCGRVGNQPVDAGGQTYYYLQNNPDLKVRFFEDNFIHNYHFVLGKTTHIPIHDENIFFHYYAGTNWTRYADEYHIEKTKLLNSVLNNLVSK